MVETSANTDDRIVATVEEEFDRQLANLVDKGYPGLAGTSVSEFTAHVEPLRGLVHTTKASTESSIGFVIVVKSSLVPTVEAVERFVIRSKPGFTDMADEIDSYKAIEAIDVPASDVYLLVDIDTGRETLNIRPNDALPRILASGRTPLTTDEGVALVTQFPTIFNEHNAFQALGSRTDNKRIPSFWISKGAPRLGWCWAGNPHTWLGAGSAATRHGLAGTPA